MHLKYDNPLFKRVFLFGLILAVVVFLIMLTDLQVLGRRLPRVPAREDDACSPPSRLLAVACRTRRSGCSWSGSRCSTCTPPGSIGPKVVPAGTPAVTRRSGAGSRSGIVLLWVAADWPMHDIGEQYLYFVHMAQHILLTFVVPPVMLLATPEWLARLVVGRGRVDADRAQARPARPRRHRLQRLALLSHWPVIVNGVVERALPLRDAHRARRHRAADLDPGVRPVPRAADLTAGPDGVPVRHVDRADGAGRVAHLRRGRGLLRLRHPRPAVGPHRSPATSRSPGCS